MLRFARVLTVLAPIGAACAWPPDAKNSAELPAAAVAAARPGPRLGARQVSESPGDARAWAHELAAVDQKIHSAQSLAQYSDSYLAADRVAGHYLARARLSGDYDDYRRAESWIAEAFAVVGDRELGPFHSRASLDYTLHRLDRIDADLARAPAIPHDNLTEAAHELLIANVALQRGEYDACVEHLERSLALHEGVSNLSSMAYLVLGFGEVEESEALYAKAMTLYHGSSREPAAWLHLQLGLSDLGRGNYDEALAHYRDAEGKLKGYWLIDEHIAEILTLTGKLDEAKALYLDIIERTNNPEFMDAMAGILIEQSKPDEAKAYIERAENRYEELSAMYPEAAYGHALEHYLEFGEDAAFTVDLAEKNHALRPNAEAKVLLAQAYLKGERTKDAQRVIEEALATPWRTADLHAVASEIYAKLGDTAKAEEQRGKAKAINPRIVE